MRFVLILSFVTFIALPVQARLGENREESIRRYGQPLEEKDVISGGVMLHQLVFSKNGYRFSVGLLKGRTAALVFVKANGSDFNEDEVADLLLANSDGRTWSKGEVVATFIREWTRDDGANARYDYSVGESQSVDFASANMIAALDAAQKAEAAQKTQGF